MSKEKTTRQNRIREVLDRLYDQQPPHFREQLRRFREDPTSRVFAPLAEGYRRMGRVDEAIEICLEGLRNHPDFLGGRVALAKCYIDQKNHDLAKDELERVVQKSPENLLAQRLLGDCWIVLENPASALHCYKMALLLAPGDVQLAEKVHQLEKSTKVETPPVAVSTGVPADLNLWEELSVSPADSEMAPVPAPADPVGGEVLWGVEESPDVFGLESQPLQMEEEDPRATEELDAILGAPEHDDESFQVASLSNAFQQEKAVEGSELTTETLGDLYFSQEQYTQSLRIFEKLLKRKPTPELQKKVALCRAKLGVDRESMVRQKQIETLHGLLKRLQVGESQPEPELL